MSSTAFAHIATRAQKLDEMGDALNRDIARAVKACVQANDSELLRELAEELETNHPYQGAIWSLIGEMEQSPAYEPVKTLSQRDTLRLRDDIAQAADDATAAHTPDIESESGARLALLKMVLRHVPSVALPRLAREMAEHFSVADTKEDSDFNSRPTVCIGQLIHTLQSLDMDVDASLVVENQLAVDSENLPSGTADVVAGPDVTSGDKAQQ